MSTEAFNVVISSKNKTSPNDTNSSLLVKLKEDIYTENDEELYVCMSSFNMIKSFYACQAGLNNHFQIITRNITSGDVATDNYYISEGNYDVRTLMQEIIKLTKGIENLFQITYDAKLNKYLYKNLFQPTFNIYIKPITAGIFLGFENGNEYLISSQGTYSSKFINVSGYTTMIIKIQGDVDITNTVSNICHTDYEYDKILGVINISDVSPMDSITYANNGDNIFRHKVSSRKIPSFKIQIVNEDCKEFTSMTDWIMILRFEKVRKSDTQITQLNQLMADILYYVMKFYAYLQIPSSITLEDLTQ